MLHPPYYISACSEAEAPLKKKKKSPISCHVMVTDAGHPSTQQHSLTPPGGSQGLPRPERIYLYTFSVSSGSSLKFHLYVICMDVYIYMS